MKRLKKIYVVYWEEFVQNSLTDDFDWEPHRIESTSLTSARSIVDSLNKSDRLVRDIILSEFEAVKETVWKPK